MLTKRAICKKKKNLKFLVITFNNSVKRKNETQHREDMKVIEAIYTC